MTDSPSSMSFGSSLTESPARPMIRVLPAAVAALVGTTVGLVTGAAVGVGAAVTTGAAVTWSGAWVAGGLVGGAGAAVGDAGAPPQALRSASAPAPRPVALAQRTSSRRLRRRERADDAGCWMD